MFARGFEKQAGPLSKALTKVHGTQGARRELLAARETMSTIRRTGVSTKKGLSATKPYEQVKNKASDFLKGLDKKANTACDRAKIKAIGNSKKPMKKTAISLKWLNSKAGREKIKIEEVVDHLKGIKAKSFDPAERARLRLAGKYHEHKSAMKMKKAG